MSTDICVSAYHGAGTWRENEQSQSPFTPRRKSALPAGTDETRLVDSSTDSQDGHEYLKRGSRVPPQSVWGVVAVKEQRFNGTQPRVTKPAAYTRGRSLSGIVKQVNRERRLRKKLLSDIESHDSRSTVEVVEEPKTPESTELEDTEDSSTIVCTIDTRLQNNNDSSGQLEKEKESSTDILGSSNSSLTTAAPLPTKTHKNSIMSSRSSRHSSSSHSSSPSTSKGRRHLSPPRTTSPPPNSPTPVSSSRSSPKRGKADKNKEKDNNDDWHQIHEPEQRRRVQNRIAQRKFREKARSLKDQQARDKQNKKYAGCAYTCPDVDDLPLEHESYEVNPENDPYTDIHTFKDGEEGGESTGKKGDTWLGGERESGLPWGGLSMRYMIGRGHEYYRYQTSRGSGSGSGSGTATITSLSPTITALGPPTPLPTGASGGGDAWPSLQHSRPAVDYRHMTSPGSAGSPLSPYGMMPMGMDLMSGGDMDVDYTMVSGAGRGGGGGGGADTGMDYVTSPSVSMAGVPPGTGMDVTYYDSSPYYYGYGNHGGGGDAVSGSGGSVYGGHGGRHL